MPVEIQSAMLRQFQRVDPKVTGQITPQESVKKQLDVISRLNSTMSGTFVSHNGNQEWF